MQTPAKSHGTWGHLAWAALILVVAAAAGLGWRFLGKRGPLIQVRSGMVVSRRLGLSAPVPAGWSAEVQDWGVLLQAPDGNTVLAINAVDDDSTSDALEVPLSTMLKGYEAKFGSLSNTTYSPANLGPSPARQAAFILATPRGPLRTELTVARSGKRLVWFNCSSPAASFAGGSPCQPVMSLAQLKP